jgi:ribonucleoside-diphosphate reductase alpha chain
MDSAQEGVKLSSNALLVLQRRYLMKDAAGNPAETPSEMFQRVAHFIAQAEHAYDSSRSPFFEEEFFRMMARLEFLPNSPTLMNAGRELGQLAACFVIPVTDSLDSIFDGVKYTAKIHQTGGGTGFSFSKLRPKDDVVASTMGVASGPVSFIKVFNMATDVIKQGGTRRGANMGILRIDHPDIEEFVTIKHNPGELSNFNLSVAVTDAFMQAYNADSDFALVNPRTGQEVKKVRARDLLRLIADSAWASGDPGVIFIDTINRANPTPHMGEIEATNPCVTRDTFVLTASGPRQVQDLLGKQTTIIVDGKPFLTGRRGFFKTGRRPVFQLDTEEGYALRLTESHPVLRVVSLGRSGTSTEWVETKEVKKGDKLLLHNHRLLRNWPGPYGEAEGYLAGLLLGEGKPAEGVGLASVWIASGDESLALVSPSPPSESKLSLGHIKQVATHLEILSKEKVITPALEKSSAPFYRGFLRGLFDCDGSVEGTQRKGVSVRLSGHYTESFLQGVQRMLLRLGIVSRIIEERRSDQAAGARIRYELVITNNNVQYFDLLVGFGDPAKLARLKRLLTSYKRLLNRERFTVTVKALTALPDEDVYDVRVPGVNAFDANGFYVHNCGEQPLLPWESCTLGSINLSRLARNGEIDWDRLKELTHLGVRFLDDVVEMNKYPLPEIEKMSRGNRKIGLGVMGFAHMLIRLGIRYDVPEAEILGEQVMAFIEKESKVASKLLAEERGPFPNYEGSVWQKRNLLQRNATTTTVAPTGTLSIIANTSSGIEPIFETQYSRILFGDIHVQVVDPLYEEMKESIERAASIRGLFRTAFQVAPLDHLKMQRAFQKCVDNAVSKTINLPYEATPETILDIYVQAHHLGLKGTTVFRDKSKEFQVLSCGTQVC